MLFLRVSARERRAGGVGVRSLDDALATHAARFRCTTEREVRGGTPRANRFPSSSSDDADRRGEAASRSQRDDTQSDTVTMNARVLIARLRVKREGSVGNGTSGLEGARCCESHPEAILQLF